jgi:hypothetical protein
MFGESKEYEELIKISLQSYVWVEVMSRSGSCCHGMGKIETACIELKHKGTYPLWLEVWPTFLGGGELRQPLKKCKQCNCRDRGIYFDVVWDHLGAQGLNESRPCSYAATNSIKAMRSNGTHDIKVQIGVIIPKLMEHDR